MIGMFDAAAALIGGFMFGVVAWLVHRWLRAAMSTNDGGKIRKWKKMLLLDSGFRI